MPVVVQTRGDVAESRHPFAVAAAVDGKAHALFGDDEITPFRSAAKPFQLATSLALLGDPDLADELLAIGAASHSGEPTHVSLAQAVLRQFDLDEGQLRCGTHAPTHNKSAAAVLRAGGKFSDIHNNCSGKHAFMLAAAKAVGAPLDYRPFDHPVQQQNVALLSELSGHPPQLAVDGCGVPTFCLPLSAIARAWSRLAAAMDAPSGEASATRLAQVGWAMGRNPYLTSGTGRFDLSVAEAAKAPIVVKIGAMGVFCIAVPSLHLGIAVKVASGNTEALAPAVAYAFGKLAPKVWAEPEGWSHLNVTNVVGRVVGRWQAFDSSSTGKTASPEGGRSC